MRTRRAESGFTLIELMVVVAIVGALAKVVVPGFFTESRRSSYAAEVSAVFSEVMVKELQYRQEFGTYHSINKCLAAPSVTGVKLDTACITPGSDWQKLRANPGLPTITCAYQVVIGCSPADVAGVPAGVKFKQGNGEWFFVVATCGTGADIQTYVSGSANSKIQQLSGAAAYTTNARVTCAGRGE